MAEKKKPTKKYAKRYVYPQQKTGEWRNLSSTPSGLKRKKK